MAPMLILIVAYTSGFQPVGLRALEAFKLLLEVAHNIQVYKELLKIQHER